MTQAENQALAELAARIEELPDAERAGVIALFGELLDKIEELLVREAAA